MKHFLRIATLAVALAATNATAQETAVYVSATGSNVNSGLSPDMPVSSISRGLLVAAGAGRTKVHVAGGSYAAFTMANGIDVIGGFDAQFVPSSSVTTTIVATYMSTYSQDVAIVAQGITQPTRLAGLVLQQQSTGANRNSIGLLIGGSSAALIVENLRINGASIAGAGMSGAPGSSATQSAAPGGGAGASAQPASACSQTTSPGGAGGNGGSSADGGQGGAGGRAYTGCNPFPNTNATPGQAGLAAIGGGNGGAGTPANSTSIGGNGGNGTSQDGASGQAGTGALVMNGGNPFRNLGTDGTLGTQGTAGGGGGGGGGLNIFARGAGGGGGGAGGLRAPTAGQPGAAGSHSIGILVFNSSPTIRNCVITRGSGSVGGRGGAGGAGQPGGPGGAGGAGYQKSSSGSYFGRGGAGGSGARGGHSGAGAGGPGGHSIAILRNSLSSPTLTGLTYVGGAGGAGGLGGAAPHQSGANGLPGGVYDVMSVN